MATSKMLPFVIHILVLFSLSFETAISESREGRALVKWKNTLSNTHDVLHSWSIANLDNVCWNWMGVTCSNAGVVYEIKLENLNLSGTLESLDLISFPNLTHFSLYRNNFTGSIPYAIANLSELRSLDLSWNYFQNVIPTDIERLTKLRSLYLGENNLIGNIPSQIFSNMSKLRYFDCGGSNLFQGPFPGNLVKLSTLKELSLNENQFSGSIPPTIGNLSSLRILDLNDNMLQGTIPQTLCNLHSLEYLVLSKNCFDGVVPKCLGNVTSLVSLSLSSNILQGNIPKTLCNLHSLQTLYLDSNRLRGLIPPCLGNITLLSFLSLGYNIMQGNIPQTLCKIHSLESLLLDSNSLGGLIPPCLGNVTSLSYLSLSSNFLQGNIPKGLCNLQQSLEVLILSNNSLDGSVPQCLGKLKLLTTLIVSKNQLQGMITPTPTLRNDTNQTTNSSLIYGRDTWFCGLSSLKFLDLSDNNLHGSLPQCLENFSRELVVINLARNQLQGFTPGVCTNRNNLEYFNLNGNQLGGSLPRDLINCNKLKFIDLGDNMLHDSFPHWLDTLPDLRVLVLRSNQFYGEICTSNTTLPFQKLHIFDISDNEFTGPLPRYYMENFEAMQHTNDDGTLSAFEASISLVWKGVEVQVVHYDIFTLLDLSNNDFHGEVPRSLAKLRFIRFLNLSHNQLTGNIPSSLGNLTLLEVLDLSCNQLVGNIPMQLSRSLTFLAVFNLSYNHLSGPIPHGSQFNTFGNDSYLGNMALCGLPLTLKCQDKGEGKASNDKDSQHFGSGLGWQSVIIGYCFGAPVGISIGYFLFKHGNFGWLKRWNKDWRLYNLPNANEVAALIVLDLDPSMGDLDILYPLLFPYGEDGYPEDITFSDAWRQGHHGGRTRITPKEYFSFYIHEKVNEKHTLLYSRRLFQQYLVDAYTMIEYARMIYIRTHQNMLRCEAYQGLSNALTRGKLDPTARGKRIILPSSFTGGARYMIQNYQDAMAICSHISYAHLFITFTCNPKRYEIERYVAQRGLKAEDRPDIVCRVFKMKLDAMIEEIKTKKAVWRHM
ncbi:PREDICTED: receptor-like protein 12 [Ipomoea nil]|uniref:receptor-like protein 12 n=1 Tax=Ipomoea nil TaxID=35883 RepID=UPI00090109F8|nr:PREDICTED: receptor-like protein 12 [Ipomoea nil]